MRIIVEDATIEDMNFEEFTEWLGRQTGANIMTDWRALESAGIERDFPLSIKAKGLAIRQLLILVFDQVTSDHRSVELAARADGNTLFISTRPEINSKLMTRVYNVQDLLSVVPDFEASCPAASGAGKRGDVKVAKVGGARKQEKSAKAVAEELIDAIILHIHPLTWNRHGGTGTIRFHDGRLIVRNNIEVHQLLAGAIKGEAEADIGVQDRG